MHSFFRILCFSTMLFAIAYLIFTVSNAPSNEPLRQASCDDIYKTVLASCDDVMEGQWYNEGAAVYDRKDHILILHICERISRDGFQTCTSSGHKDVKPSSRDGIPLPADGGNL